MIGSFGRFWKEVCANTLKRERAFVLGMSTKLLSPNPPPHFPVALSDIDREKTVEKARKIIFDLRPDWKDRSTDDSGNNALGYEFFTGGITNTILSMWSKKTGGKNDRILLRIYGEKTELVIDRNAEKRNMALLNHYGCAAPLYGTFENGVIYGYVPGRVLNSEDVRDPHLSELIAKQMAKMHTIGFENAGTASNLLDGKLLSREPVLLSKLTSFIVNLPTHFEEPGKQEKFATEFPSKQELLVELESIRGKVKAIQSPVVFCHNDLLIKNLIYDNEKDLVRFIDYEYAGYNYQAFDIGNHFCEYAGVETVDFSLFPEEEHQKRWLRNYLKYWREFVNSGQQPTNQDLNVLYIQVNVFAPLAHFWWALWALIQARYSTINFDFVQYGIDRMNEYKKLKSKVWDWKIDQ